MIHIVSAHRIRRYGPPRPPWPARGARAARRGGPARAQVPSTPATAPEFEGAPATPRPVPAPPVPRHPHMAANERSNLHDDAYQTDAYLRSGPLGIAAPGRVRVAHRDVRIGHVRPPRPDRHGLRGHRRR